jgi:hypothetical protein
MKQAVIIFTLVLITFSGHAFYSPTQSRWVSRDPIEEEGGHNLYVFAKNAPMNHVDLLGLLVSGWYDINTGIMVITDDETKESITLCGESGGKPFGDPIPAGPYEILNHPNNDFLRLDPVDEIPRNDTHEETGRTYFRLHKPGRTIGCIAAKDECRDCWERVRDMIRATKTEDVQSIAKRRWPLPPAIESIKKFGTLSVKNTTTESSEAEKIRNKCKCSCGHRNTSLILLK